MKVIYIIKKSTMKKLYLLYIPTGLNSPEFEVLLSTAQLLIDKKKDVEIVTCGGEVSGEVYATSSNVFSQSSIDNACKYKRNIGFKMLKGEFKLTYTSNLKNYKKFFKKYNFNDRKKINQILIEKVDIGSCALSSYLDLSRDAYLDGLLAKKTIKNLMNTSLNLMLYFKNKLKKNHHLIMYNGRNNEYRPVLRVANLKKIKVSNLEWSGDGEKNVGIRDFKNHLPQDINNLGKIIDNHWKASSKINKCDHYFHYIKAGRVINDKASYVLKQNKDLLPKEWDNSKRNIVYFTSSMDEYFALGGVFDKTIYEDQTISIKKIISSLKKTNDKNVVLWIRCHPNLSNVFWKYNSEIYKLHDPSNRIFIINPRSKISSYKMLLNCEKIVNYASRTGIEAVYWKKPSIVLGRSAFEKLNSAYHPKNHNETMKLILDSELKPKPQIGAIKWASYWVEGGYTQKYFDGSLRYGFKFKNTSIRFNLKIKLVYYVGKIIQYYLYNYLANYKFSFLKKVFNI